MFGIWVGIARVSERPLTMLLDKCSLVLDATCAHQGNTYGKTGEYVARLRNTAHDNYPLTLGSRASRAPNV